MAKKKRSVPVASMGDMVKLFNHNCNVFDRSITKLVRRNRSLRLLCAVTIGCAVHAAMECRKQEEKLYQLSVRVKKLERGEGE